jgi:hypothetical protein
MILLALLLALDAVLHGFLIYRFGTHENVPFLIFAFIDAALAVAVFLAVPSRSGRRCCSVPSASSG